MKQKHVFYCLKLLTILTAVKIGDQIPFNRVHQCSIQARNILDHHNELSFELSPLVNIDLQSSDILPKVSIILVTHIVQSNYYFK